MHVYGTLGNEASARNELLMRVENPNNSSRNLRPVLAVVIAVGLVAAIAVVALVRNGKGNDVAENDSLTSSSTQPLLSVSSGVPRPPSVDASTAVWPYVESDVRYTSPAGAAKAFATEFLKFESPVFGEFRAGDGRSGELEMRPRVNGPVTTILIRQLNDGNWWILGATTPNIQINEPAALASVASPVRLRGTSTAFEANVQTEVRQDGSTKSLGEGFVMGGSNGELGPFDGILAFEKPSAGHGAIVLYTSSAENGQVWEAAVVRVAFNH